MGIITTSQIREIHILKSLIGLDDENYREMLASFDVQTSKNLTFVEANILLSILRNNAKSMGRLKYVKRCFAHLEDRSQEMATAQQLRMIEAVWSDICNHAPREQLTKSLRKFLQNKFKTDDITFLTKKKAIKVVQAVLNMRNNVLGKQKPCVQ